MTWRPPSLSAGPGAGERSTLFAGGMKKKPPKKHTFKFSPCVLLSFETHSKTVQVVFPWV